MKLLVPREDVNDDSAMLQRWLADDQEEVKAGQPLCLLETSKTVFEVTAPADGKLHRRAREGQELPVGAVLAEIGEESLADEAETPSERAFKLTREAERYAAQHQLDLSRLAHRGIVTLQDLQALHPPPRVAAGVPRVLLVGAGSVGMQVLDILLHDPALQPVGLLDDDPSVAERFGLRVLGKLADLESLYRDGVFDQAIITLGLNLELKRRYFDRCQQAGIRLANAIDPTARINRGAVLGQGNVLCSFVHLGVEARLGDNNFVAAHSSLDHHNEIASHCLFGPGCLFSGRVKVGEQCLFGSGVIIQPNISVGNHCKVASGAVILRNVPDHGVVRLRVQHEIVSHHD